MSAKTAKPAIEGWFTTGTDEPALLGTRCTACDTRYFPKVTFQCRNPACGSRDLEEVELSRTGTIWSYTDACYQPPPPYVPVSDPFESFALAAVELEAEKMVVLGQVVGGVGVDDLATGMRVELVLDTLFSDDEHDYLIWKWRPLGAETEEAAG